MVVLSLILHGLLLLTAVFSSLIWSRRHVLPLIHYVELVNLPQERVQQPKIVPEEEPKPAEHKAKIERQLPLKITKRNTKTKPIEEKKVVRKETAVVEKPQDSQEPRMPSSEPVEEASIQSPAIPEVMPLLQKPYTEYEFYHAQIARVIRSRWAPPPTTLADRQMKAVVAFKLSRAGRIEGDVSLEESSGSLFYDQAALRATMGPLPPPPPGYPEELLKMKLIYVLDQSRLN
jgi:TonB family protein